MSVLGFPTVVHEPDCPGRPGHRGICSCDKREVTYADAILAAILAAVLRRILADSGYIGYDHRLYIGDISDNGADLSDDEAAAIQRVLNETP